MPDLHIPDDALGVVVIRTGADFTEAKEVLEAGAPLVVAAELRRLAVAIAPQAGVVDGSDAMTRRACAAELVARADELDGGA